MEQTLLHDPFRVIILLMGRLILLGCWLAFLIISCKKRNGRITLIGIMAVGVLAIVIDFARLYRPYGMHLGIDGIVYLAHAMTVAVGNPPLDDFALSGVPTGYSPVFPLVVAISHWITRIPAITLYKYGPLLTVVLLPLSAYALGKKLGGQGDGSWLGVLMAFFVMFLTQDPLDLQFHEMGFWDQVVLYKPGHGFAFIAMPLFYYFFASRDFRRGYLIASLVLTFIIVSMLIVGGFVICGLVLYPVAVYLLDRERTWLEAQKTLIVITLGLLLSSWYWLRPFVYATGRGFLLGHSEVGLGLPATWPGDIPVVFDPFEATFFMMPLFWLGIIGLVYMLHRRERGDLVLVSYIVAMYLGKAVAPFTWLLFNFAPQAWELSLWGLRIGMAMAAGVGVFATLRFAHSRHEGIIECIRSFSLYPALRSINGFYEKLVPPSWRIFRLSSLNHFSTWVFLCLLLLTPYMASLWRLPTPRDKPIPTEIQNYTAWIRENTHPRSVFLTDSDTSEWIGALTGRKVMVDREGRNPFGNFLVRKRDATTAYNSCSAEEIMPLLNQYRVSYIIVNEDTVQEYPEICIQKFYDEDYFEVMYEQDKTTIFKLKSR